MQFTHDSDLAFLRQCSSEDLELLYQYLMLGSNPEAQRAEDCTSLRESVAKPDNNAALWRKVAAGFLSLGLDPRLDVAGDRPASYRQILRHVCKINGVEFSDRSLLFALESSLVAQVLLESFQSLDRSHRTALVDIFRTNEMISSCTKFEKNIQLCASMSGFVSYKSALVIADSISKSVAGAGGFEGGRGLGSTWQSTACAVGKVVSPLVPRGRVVGIDHVRFIAVVQIVSMRARWSQDRRGYWVIGGDCPQCGFSYRWNGSQCAHCGYGIIERSWMHCGVRLDRYAGRCWVCGERGEIAEPDCPKCGFRYAGLGAECLHCGFGGAPGSCPCCGFAYRSDSVCWDGVRCSYCGFY